MYNNLDLRNTCPECDSAIIQDIVKGEFICSICGYVLQDNLEDFGQDSFSNDSSNRTKNIRASGVNSISYHDFGLHTEIDNQFRDYTGKHFKENSKKSILSLRKWNSIIRISSSKERRLSNVLSRINEITSLLSVPKVVCETAALLYRNYESKCDTKGKSTSCMAAASVYYACKVCRVLRSLNEIVRCSNSIEHSNDNQKLASKYYRAMVMVCENEEHLSQHQPEQQNKITDYIVAPVQARSSIKTNHSISNLQSISINQYISKLANIAKFDIKIERLALDIAKKTENHMLSDGKSPNGIAAAYIYLASVLLGINILQMDISRLAGVTEVTIRNRCKDILTCFKIVLKVKPSLKV
ncbi:transcription initiation factor IIB [Candidatus Nitrosocosmicus franklandus]|uniref:Transcription initiation factor IIB n=1 Tax=Candidatus Nitrosocosmicus franklandianus TaxID=1798806 RepID=A0A484IE83_9ARCH|nr:TFIIB-type zinc ribbon-containing protein [Candidatus Nitrosocosmicus franklandus]VFJ15461.1 Transcription initiation factor IIB [Candidatus Nitrosocosmicus franklandus]